MTKINQLKVPIQSITRLECKLIEILSILCVFFKHSRYFWFPNLRFMQKYREFPYIKSLKMKINQNLKNELHFLKKFLSKTFFLVLINLEQVSI